MRDDSGARERLMMSDRAARSRVSMAHIREFYFLIIFRIAFVFCLHSHEYEYQMWITFDSEARLNHKFIRQTNHMLLSTSSTSIIRRLEYIIAASFHNGIIIFSSYT